MKTLLNRAVLRIAIVALVVASSAYEPRTGTSFGCSCDRMSLRVERRKASTIFVGTVDSIEIDKAGAPNCGEDPAYAWTVMFRVDTVLKGPNTASLSVRSTQGILCCSGIKFELGRRYVVYAHGEARLVIGGTRTGILDDATPDSDTWKDLRVLRRHQ